MASHTIRTLFDITYRVDIKQVIIELNPTEWAYIYHDKDTLTDGTPKKPHYHIWCRWDTPVRNSTMANVLGRTNHLCITAKSQKACIRYMTHETNDAIKMGKYQYDRSDIITNLDTDDITRMFLITEITQDKVNSILELILSYSDDPSREFTLFINDIIRLNCLDVYQKFYNSVFRRLVDNTFKV